MLGDNRASGWPEWRCQRSTGYPASAVLHTMSPNAPWMLGRKNEPRLTELVTAGTDVPGVAAACLRPPLYATRFGAGFGTLYTAEYRPAEGIARYHWPQHTWEHSLRRLGTDRIDAGLGIS
jgi:hypothetical protein